MLMFWANILDIQKDVENEKGTKKNGICLPSTQFKK